MKNLFLILTLLLTVVFCTAPSFHPEAVFVDRYRVWLDVLLHSGYFLLVGFFIHRLLSVRPLSLWMLLLLAGVLLEWVQHFIPGRSFSWMDMGSNLAGVSVGSLVAVKVRAVAS